MFSHCLGDRKGIWHLCTSKDIEIAMFSLAILCWLWETRVLDRCLPDEEGQRMKSAWSI